MGSTHDSSKSSHVFLMLLNLPKDCTLFIIKILKQGQKKIKKKKEVLGTEKEDLWFRCLPYSKISLNSNSAPPHTHGQIKFSVDKVAGKLALFVET